MAADAVDEEGAQVKKKVRFAMPVSNVRWSTVRRRHTMSGSEGWSWGCSDPSPIVTHDTSRTH
eukprot:5717464-Prymnesium_polylepis.1